MGTYLQNGSVSLIQSYLDEIRRYKLISREDEKSLAHRIQTEQDSEAVDMLVKANLRLVVKIATDYKKAWKVKNLMDLIQEGNLGLIRASQKYDPNKNVKFSYYASFWIKAYIIKFIMENWSLVKIGTTHAQRKLFMDLKKEKQRLKKLGIEPYLEVVSEQIGISKNEIQQMEQRLNGGDVSLNVQVNENSNSEKIEFLNDKSISIEEQVAQKELNMFVQKKIREVRGTLNKREQEIFEKRVSSENPMTLQELGRFYGVSRERIRQVETNIKKKMKKLFLQGTPLSLSFYTEGIY